MKLSKNNPYIRVQLRLKKKNAHSTEGVTLYTDQPRWFISFTQLSGIMSWTFELHKLYDWYPGQKYPKTD